MGADSRSSGLEEAGEGVWGSYARPSRRVYMSRLSLHEFGLHPMAAGGCVGMIEPVKTGLWDGSAVVLLLVKDEGGQHRHPRPSE